MTQITETMVREVVQEILKQMAASGQLPAAAWPPLSQGPRREMELLEVGEAKAGTAPNEVVIALAPAFGDKLVAPDDYRHPARGGAARDDGRHRGRGAESARDAGPAHLRRGVRIA